MTPKEKAEELVDQFDEYAEARISDSGRGFDKKYCSKQCALIAVDEILTTLYNLKFGNTLVEELDYWEDIKQEIENLKTK